MRRHPLDPFSLLTGAVLALWSAAYVVAGVIGATPSAQLMYALLLVGLGAAGLVAAIVAQRRGAEAVESAARGVAVDPVDSAMNPDDLVDPRPASDSEDAMTAEAYFTTEPISTAQQASRTDPFGATHPSDRSDRPDRTH